MSRIWTQQPQVPAMLKGGISYAAWCNGHGYFSYGMRAPFAFASRGLLEGVQLTNDGYAIRNSRSGSSTISGPTFATGINPNSFFSVPFSVVLKTSITTANSSGSNGYAILGTVPGIVQSYVALYTHATTTTQTLLRFVIANSYTVVADVSYTFTINQPSSLFEVSWDGANLTLTQNGVLLATGSRTNTSSLTSLSALNNKSGYVETENYQYVALFPFANASVKFGLLDNPWQIFQPLPSRIFVGPAATSGGVAGALAVTQDGNTIVATALLALAGAGSATQDANTIASTAVLAVQGTASIAQAGNAATATATLALQGTATVAQAAQTVSASGTLAEGNAGALAADQGSHTVAGAGTLALQASAAITQSSHMLVATGAGAIGNTGAITAAQAAHSLAATGTAPILGTLAAQLDGHVVIALGQHNSFGSANLLQGGHAVAAIGASDIQVIAAARSQRNTSAARRPVTGSRSTRHNHSTGCR